MIIQSTTQMLKAKYRPGNRILVHSINDPFVPLDTDTLGTIERIDDIGTIHVTLDNGITLGLIYGIDSFQPA